MRAHGLLLARTPRFVRPERRHDGKVAVELSNAVEYRATSRGLAQSKTEPFG